ERDTIAGLSLDMTSILGGVRKDPWQAFLDDVPDRDDPVTRQGLAQLFIEQRAKEVTLVRANTARLRGQQPGAEGSVNKAFNAEFNQRRVAFAMNAAGAAAIAWEPGDNTAESRRQGFPRAPANPLAGGTAAGRRTPVPERGPGRP